MELLEIKKALAERAADVCALLLPEGKQERNEWVGGRLASGDGGHSLKIILTGEKAGVWKDFGGDVGGSNLLELWVQAKGLPFQEALHEAKAWLAERGGLRSEGMKPARAKEYSKPSKKGITFIANAAQFYLHTTRQIPRDVIELYRIAMTDDEKAIVFPYLHEDAPNAAQMIKYLALERDEHGKKNTWTSKNTPKVLFGKHTVRPDDRYIIITEGEVDAMSYRAVGLTGLSVPFGAKWESKDGRDPNDEWIENDWDFLNRFERIYLSLDMDEEGRKAQASIVKRLGQEKCYIINLPVKDANEMLTAGRGEELQKCFESARTLDPEILKNAGEYRQAVIDRMTSADGTIQRGIPLPFGNYPFHLRWNEWTAVTGINGSGKSQVLGWLILYLWKLGHASCIGSFEVPAAQTLVYYVIQALGQKSPPREKIERALDWLAGGIWFYDKVGSADWKDVLAVFRYAYRRYGVRFFVIDSWMKLGIKDDDYEAQGEFLNALSAFVMEFPVHVFVVAHPRKLKNETEVVGKLDVKGSGELTDQAHNVIIMWRNKVKEREIEKMQKAQDDAAKILQKQKLKPDSQLIVAKQRNDDGDEPTIDLWLIKTSKQFYGHFRQEPQSLLEDKPLDTEAPPQTEVQEELDEDIPF